MKKKLFGLMTGLAMLAGMTSCSDDQELSINMAGEWRGTFGTYYTIKEGGHDRIYYADETYIRFTPDHTYATHGHGTQTDYFDYGPYTRQWYQFDWEVKNERIYLTYHEYSELNVIIENFDMNQDYFSGRCGKTSFRLHKISDYYDWSPYENGHGYSSREGYYYAPTRADGDATEPVIIRRGNRMME